VFLNLAAVMVKKENGMNADLRVSMVTFIGGWSITVLSPGPNFFATAYTATTHRLCHRRDLHGAGG